ncbi:MAG: hypothetical protein A2Y15_07440 [Clostridiales bacterium GWF2_36_10]|nr:MAG: hypothetical protein A2Y15_07440 [Clostridiales bacterium GWF2_36_10]
MSSIPRIFITKEIIEGNTVRITGSDAFHLLKVLRLRAGDHIIICNMKRTEFDGVISKVDGEDLFVTLGEGKICSSELPFEVTLYQGIPKGDKFDTIIQKSVELGVTSIVPVLCERCVSRPDDKAFAKKIERLNKIASSASSQCGRGIIPTVKTPVSYKKACEEMQRDDLYFICYEGSETLHIKNFLEDKNPNKISFLIGPEGGLSSGETDIAIEHGIPLIGLGNRILRTETASGFVLSVISILLEK